MDFKINITDANIKNYWFFSFLLENVGDSYV